MSKSRDYSFYKAEELTDWSGNVIPRDLCDNLVTGDIVRLCLNFSNGCWTKYYFEITKIDYYKYGGINKPRKFYGKVLDIYCKDSDYWSVIGKDHETTFRKEDIFELPGWKSDSNPLTQPNLDIINKEISKQNVKNFYRENNEFNKKQEKRNKLNQIVKNFRDKLNAKYQNCESNENIYSIKKLKNYVLEQLGIQDSQLKNLDWGGLEHLFTISNISEQNIIKILDSICE